MSGEVDKSDGIYIPLNGVRDKAKWLSDNLRTNKQYAEYVPEAAKVVADEIYNMLLEITNDLKLSALNEIYCSPPNHVIEFTKKNNNFLSKGMDLTMN